MEMNYYVMEQLLKDQQAQVEKIAREAWKWGSDIQSSTVCCSMNNVVSPKQLTNLQTVACC